MRNYIGFFPTRSNKRCSVEPVNALNKIFASIFSLVAGIVGSRVLENVWAQVTGADAPTKKNKEAREEASATRVALFAAISAGMMALIQTSIEQGSKKAAKRSKDNPEEI